MTKTERAIAILSGLIAIGTAAWNVISAMRSQPVPFWLYALSVVTAFIVGLFACRISRHNKKTLALRRLGALAFDYLPASPEQNGWHLGVEVENGKLPTFSAASDAPKPGALHIAHSDRYFMDFTVDQALSLSNLAEFFIRFAKSSAFYFRVKLSTRDGSQRREGWLCYAPDHSTPHKAGSDEWSLPISGDIMNDGWIDARISIADDVARTYGTEGWLYGGLRRIRLRGTLSLSSITFSRMEIPNNEVEVTR